MGIQSDLLFPAWVLTQRQALASAGISPRTVELVDNHVSAVTWPSQSEVDWILSTGSIVDQGMAAVARPVISPRVVPYILQWIPDRASTGAVSRFVDIAGDPVAVPAGWSKSAEPAAVGDDLENAVTEEGRLD